MPHPRFNKLSPQKQKQIMEAAAKEFSAYDFERASLNRILEAAEISKGAAYYYFDDKADVFSTVVQYYSRNIMGDATEFALDELTAETFWSTLTQIYQQQLTYTIKYPWAMGVFKSVTKLSPAALAANESLVAMMEQIQGRLLSLLQQGQMLGVIRRDLPDDLMLNLFWAIDDMHDQWLLAHQATLSSEDIKTVITPRLIDLLQRIFEPDRKQESQI